MSDGVALEAPMRPDIERLPASVLPYRSYNALGRDTCDTPHHAAAAPPSSPSTPARR